VDTDTAGSTKHLSKQDDGSIIKNTVIGTVLNLLQLIGDVLKFIQSCIAPKKEGRQTKNSTDFNFD
jgi:hypothetical protein